MPKGRMRRQDLWLNGVETKAILREAEIATVCTVDREGQPYGVAVNFAFDGSDKIYFHSAAAGHKLENIRDCPKVCLSVVGAYQTLATQMSAYYRSVTGFGTARFVGEPDTKAKALQLIMGKYCPGVDCRGRAHTAAETTVVEITLDLITGKRSARTPENPGS